MVKIRGKLVWAFLLKYWYPTTGYDIICLLCEVLVLDSLGQYRMGKYWH